MKKSLFSALTGFVILVTGNAYAKTTYIKCGYLSYKLEEPFIGSSKFYKMTAGTLELLPSDVDENFIRYWLDEEHKNSWPDGFVYINRVTGEEVGDPFKKCELTDKLKF